MQSICKIKYYRQSTIKILWKQPWRCSVKKIFLKKIANLTGKYLRWSLFLENFVKKREEKKRDFKKGVFLWNLLRFKDTYLFWRASSNDQWLFLIPQEELLNPSSRIWYFDKLCPSMVMHNEQYIFIIYDRERNGQAGSRERNNFQRPSKLTELKIFSTSWPH